MDIEKALRGLHEEKKWLGRAIKVLEKQLADPSSPLKGKRGRKAMSSEERLELSRRMTVYWAKRRNPPAQPDEQIQSDE